MLSLSRVILAFSDSDADMAAAGSLASGFGQIGATVERATRGVDVKPLLDAGGTDLVVASLRVVDALDLVKSLRSRKVPVVVLGDAVRRKEAMAAGAADFVAEPAYVRDVVTLGRFLHLPRKGELVSGDLEGLSLFHLARALSAAGRTGVLFVSRSNRRGELRLYHGEITSAQAGVHHGLAALHQLLLWPEAEFEWHAETVVRRQQIPLTPAELSENVGRFLKDYREMSCGVSPSLIFEVDLKRLGELSDWVPREAQNIIELFDGTRALADVIEDSPLRLPDTLRVAVKLIEVGVLKKMDAPRTIANPTAALVVEDWIVGQAQPAAAPPAPAPPAAPVAKDWGKLDGAAHKDFAPVVPASSQSGEISVPPLPPGAVAPAPAPAPPPRPPAPAPPLARASAPVPVAAAPVPVPVEPPKKLGKSTGKKAAIKGRDTGKHKAGTGPHKALRHFEDHEQAFFDEEHRIAAEHAEEADDFSDLDEGHEGPAPGFWRRLWDGLQGKGGSAQKPK